MNHKVPLILTHAAHHAVALATYPMLTTIYNA